MELQDLASNITSAAMTFGAHLRILNTVLVHQETQQPRAGIQYQKEKHKTSRYFIQTGGSLTGSEGQRKAQEHEELAQQVPRQRRPPTCSNATR